MDPAIFGRAMTMVNLWDVPGHLGGGADIIVAARGESGRKTLLSSCLFCWKNQGEKGCCAGEILCVSGFSSSVRNSLRVLTHPSQTQHFSPPPSWKDQGEKGCCAGVIFFDNRHFHQYFFCRCDSEFREEFRQQTLSELAKTINIICSFVVRGVKIGVVGS